MNRCRLCDHDVPVGAHQCPNCGAPVDTNAPQTAEDLERQIGFLLEQGQKLEAVKLYKDQTGASLKEAKDAVEVIEHGPSPTSPSEPEGQMEAELLRLLRAGKKVEAAKIYKQQRGVQLIEAKQAVEALAAKHGIAAEGGGCAGVLAAIVLLCVLLGATIA
jgi:ribosomal protein L7/L12